MKKVMMACCVMLMTSVLLPSCLGDDDDVTYYDNVSVTSFTLGTLNRYLTATAADGSDSTYKKSYNASSVKMHIDHLGGRIFNSDSLPIGTDLKHVVCTLATKNNALATIKSTRSDSLFAISSTDSLDFSQPRTVRVFSTDGEHWRDYTVTLSVRQQEAGVLRWTRTEEQIDESTAYAPADSIDTSRLDDDASLVPTLALTGVTWQTNAGMEYTLWAGLRAETDTAMTLWRRLKDTKHESQWVLMTQAEDNPYYLPASQQTVLAYVQGYLLALSADGTIYRSQDQGITWKTSDNLQMPDDFGGAPMTVISLGDRLLLTDGTGKKWSGSISR